MSRLSYSIFIIALFFFIATASAENETNVTEPLEQNVTNQGCINLLTELNTPIVSDIGYFWCGATDWIRVQLPAYGIDLAGALLLVIVMALLLFFFGRGSMIFQGWIFKVAVLIVIGLFIFFVIGSL